MIYQISCSILFVSRLNFEIMDNIWHRSEYYSIAEIKSPSNAKANKFKAYLLIYIIVRKAKDGSHQMSQLKFFGLTKSGLRNSHRI